MRLIELDGVDLDLRLTEAMLRDLPDELNGMFRIGEISLFDAVGLAHRYGMTLAPELQALSVDHAFTAVRIPISIRPPERANVRFLSVDIQLRSSGGRAVAWSMDPQSVTDSIAVSSKFGLTAALTLSVAEVTPEAQRDEEYTIRQPRITAFNVGSSDPAWEFLPTKAGELSGVQLLTLVVKAPRHLAWSGEVAIRADVAYRRLLWNTVAIRRGRDDARVASFGSSMTSLVWPAGGERRSR
jgi:hypothetical protein